MVCTEDLYDRYLKFMMFFNFVLPAFLEDRDLQ